MRKVKLIQTCEACPSQWEGYTDENEPVYIRFRWGYLSVRIGEVGQAIRGAVDGKEIFGQGLGGGLDGVLSFEQLKKELEGKLEIEEEK